MGPNGGGKSTFAKSLAGHPAYEITGGKIAFRGENLLELSPDERARRGVFLGFQYPVEVPGVSTAAFLRQSYNAVAAGMGREELDPLEFDDFVQEKLESVGMDPALLERSVNEGFSGGEKKRNEILQMAILQPRLALLDEIDSGLDVDALKAVAKGINALMNGEVAMILVTHYQRLLDYVKPDFVHVLVGGKIVKSGTSALAVEIEERGYDWIMAELDKGDAQ
jgi:Fe-S cluster assembly ATP-binding protein